MSETQKKSLIENRLLKYSIAASALIAASESVQAGPGDIVTNYDGQVLQIGDPAHAISFGGTNEFTLQLPASGTANLNIFTGNFAIANSSAPYAVIPLAVSYNISAFLPPWGNNNVPGNLNNFAGQGDKHIGVYFTEGPAQFYGWIKITLSANGPMQTLTIHGWAYDSAGDPIHVDGVVPVELTFCSALQMDGAVKLLWETATEVNNHGFEVERSAFRGQRSGWEKVGFVEGAGNSNVNREYSFIDNSPLIGEVYYRLKQIDNDGTFDYSDEVKVTLDGPDNYALQQNYPNPFNPVTSIRFTIPESSLVTLKVYNSIGELVAELLNQNLEAGSYDVDFDASNLPSGAYIYKIAAGSKFSAERKMLVVK